MKGKREFPIFNSPLDLAHSHWEKVAFEGAYAIDATCGNGHDTAFLAGIFTGVIAIDLQSEAIVSSRKQTGSALYFCQCHSSFPPIAYEKPISLIVYNLGYLPGGDKRVTTLYPTTLASVKKGLELILPGGLISITCYPGHPEGAVEEAILLEFARKLDPEVWSASHLTWTNRNKGPSLLLLQKNKW